MSETTPAITAADLPTLEAARELLLTPGKWAQGYYAFTNDGTRCAAQYPEAVRFCAAGGCAHVTPPSVASDPIDYWEHRLQGYVPAEFTSVAEFNDWTGRTPEEVVAVLIDPAIADARKAKVPA